MEYLIKVSVILILFYICYKLFLNRETFFESNRSFLLIGLATAFVLPLIVIPKYIEVEPIITQSDFVISETQTQQLAANNSISLSTILTYIYALGVLFFLIRFLVQFSSLMLLYVNSTKQRVASYIYVITKKTLSPFSFFNWIVFNPKLFNDKELEQIITHEKVHAQQLHSIDILMVEITSIILWFNPFIWLYKKDLRQNLEFIADKNAHAITNCKKSYQHLLLKTSVPNYQLAVTNNFYNSLIKKRIVMLHKNRSNNRNQLKFLLVLPALAVFLMSFNTKEIYINKEATSIKSSTVLKLNQFESANNDVSSETTKPTTSKTTINKDETIKQTKKQDIVTYFIESNFTDAQLDEVIKKLKSHGITLKIKGVKRNNDNEIIALKIDAKSKNSNANFSIDNDSAIKTVKITYKAKDNSITIGNSDGLIHGKDYMYRHKDGVVTFEKAGKGQNTFVYSIDKDHVKNHEVIEDDDKIIIKSGGKVHELKKANNGKNTFIISDDKDGNVFEFKGKEGETYEIIKADTLSSDGKIFKLKGNVVIQSQNKDGNVFIHSDDNKNEKVIIKSKGSTLWTDDNDKKVIIKSSTGKSLWINDHDDTIAVQTIGKGKSKLFISGDNDKALFVVDGKEVTKKEFDNLDTDNIQSINVFKGESGTEKYGDKGKNGVIEITTKKKKD